MLKDFWENKKYLIQLVGILCGVGALFLAIPVPTNEEESKALANIQFIWLVIVTISTTVLFIQFLLLANAWEKNLRDTKGLDMTETVSVLVFSTLVYLLVNIWQYFLNIYQDSFWDFFKTNNLWLISIFGAVYFHYWRKLVLKIPEASVYKKVIFSIISHTLGVVILAFFIEFGLKGLNFSVQDWIKISVVILIIMFVAMAYDIARIWKPKQNK